MTDLRLVARSAGRIGTIVLVGPGRGNMLETCLAAEPDRLILVEADVQAMPALSRKMADHMPGSGLELQMFQIALDAAPEKNIALLHLAGSGPFASLCAPAPDLLNLYPGLRNSTPVSVAVMSPATLGVLIDPTPEWGTFCHGPDRENILILQSPGQAAALLEAFATAGLLHRYAQVYLCEPDGAYYIGARTLDDARMVLEKMGYTCEVLEARTRMGWFWLKATPDDKCQSDLPKHAQDATKTLQETDPQLEQLRISEADKAAQSDLPRTPFKRNETRLAQLWQAEVDMVPSVELSARIADSIDKTDNVADPLSFLAEEMKNFEGSERVHLAFVLCDRYLAQKNRLMALDSLADAQEALPPSSQGLRTALARRYLDLGETWLAANTLRPDIVNKVVGSFAQDEWTRMQEALTKGVPQSIEHGHSLILSHLEKILPPPRSNTTPDKPCPVLVEVGSTRERVLGQGSTAKIAAFCKERGIHMITVDMDPRNSALARQTFARLGVDFEAITDKGEDFLAAYREPVDYVFLDAYDFDHGKHSELRQSRYEAFLGNRIDEEDCHRMHLKCAEALVDILSPDGVICIDDTWLDEAGAWTAKGKLAVPFLLQSGFHIIEARNRAILMGRTASKTRTPRT